MERQHGNAGTIDRTLQQAPEVLQTVRVNLALRIFHSMVNELVNVIAVKSLIRLQRISVQFRTGLDVIPHQLLQILFLAAGSDCGLDVTATLQNTGDQAFIDNNTGPTGSKVCSEFQHVPQAREIVRPGDGRVVAPIRGMARQA
jgi:hypothetical protein